MLELVATMPSRPLPVGVLVTLDIISRSIRLVAGTAPGGARGVQLPFIREKTLTFQTTESLRCRFGKAGPDGVLDFPGGILMLRFHGHLRVVRRPGRQHIGLWKPK